MIVYVDRNRLCRGEAAVAVYDPETGDATHHTDLDVVGRVVQHDQPMVTADHQRVHVWVELEAS